MHMQEKRRESERQRWEREVREVREGRGGEEIPLFLVICSHHSNARWQKHFDLRGQNIHHQAIPFEIKMLFYV